MVKIKNFEEIRDIGKKYYHEKSLEKIKQSNFLYKIWKSEEKILIKYRKLIEKTDKKEGNLKDNLLDFRWVLPPWYAYPFDTKQEILKTDYCKVYSVFIRTLTNDERKVYEQLYVSPEEWSHF